MSTRDTQWYVLQTYSGYEDKVASEINVRVKNMGLEHYVDDVKVLREDIEEITKDGKKRTVSKKIYLGYVFVKMLLNDDMWRLLLGIRGCVGFAGNPTHPMPLPPDEIKRLFGSKSSPNIVVPYKVNDSVQITSGPLEGVVGVVDSIDLEKQNLAVRVPMFGRETNVELDLDEVELVIK